jgi:starch phosphorylase
MEPWLHVTGMEDEELLELGRGRTDDPNAPFDMTAFVLRHASNANAVSKLHAKTATETWEAVAGHPINAITNGVHVASWLGRPMRRLYERALGTFLASDHTGPIPLEGVRQIDDADLWAGHMQQKRELTDFIASRLARQFARHGESPDQLREVGRALDPKAMTIGFARRFATYKRAGLLFSDIERLARMLRDEKRPIQVVFAGKAHPADRPGQRVIQEIFQRSRSPQLRGRVYILEDYDMHVARFLVQGVDVWLNNPRRPLEASGTSGMKAAQNGVPNISVLDGWWDEGYEKDNGWAIGGRETAGDEAAQDWSDAQDLYRDLEEELVPAYYDRDKAGIPLRWVETMRRAMASSLWQFSTTRMLQEYAELLYLPAAGVEAQVAAREPVVTEAG